MNILSISQWTFLIGSLPSKSLKRYEKMQFIFKFIGENCIFELSTEFWPTSIHSILQQNTPIDSSFNVDINSGIYIFSTLIFKREFDEIVGALFSNRAPRNSHWLKKKNYFRQTRPFRNYLMVEISWVYPNEHFW